MSKQHKLAPLIVIVGQTASGKTSLAIEIATRCNGEIICADSRTIYKHMDIGTAKPSKKEQKMVPHHLLDIVEPTETFTVYDFKLRAEEAIKDIQERGKTPILAGGSGLYIDAVIFDYQFRPAGELTARKRYETLTIAELQQELRDRGIPLPENKDNKRHLIRTAESGLASPAQNTIRSNTYIFGINVNSEEQKKRSSLRLEAMIKQGLIEEVRTLGERYGWEIAPMQAPAYKAFRRYVLSELTLDEAKVKCLRYEAQLAKKQRTWFKRNKSIQWYSDPSEIVDISTTLLNT